MDGTLNVEIQAPLLVSSNNKDVMFSLKCWEFLLRCCKIHWRSWIETPVLASRPSRITMHLKLP